MGLFSRWLGHTKDFNKIASAVANVSFILDEYDFDKDYDYLLMSGWICHLGIQKVLESGRVLPDYFLYVTIKGHIKKMTVREAYMLSIGRLIKISTGFNEVDRKYIMDVIDGGDAFVEVDKHIPEDKKRIFVKY